MSTRLRSFVYVIHISVSVRVCLVTKKNVQSVEPSGAGWTGRRMVTPAIIYTGLYETGLNSRSR